MELYIFGGRSRYYDSYKVMNGYYTVLGIFLTIAGFVLIVASYYNHDETNMAVKNESVAFD